MKGLDKSDKQRQIESITSQSFYDLFESARRQAEADALLRRCKHMTGQLSTIGGQQLSEDICEYFKQYGAQRDQEKAA